MQKPATAPPPADVVGVRMRLSLGQAEAAALDAQSRIHSWWHNYLVERVNTLRTQRDDPDARALLYGPYGLRNLLTPAKATYPFLRRCWTYSLQAAAIRVTATVQATRGEIRARRGLPPLPDTPWAGWPRFHRWSSHWASLEYHTLTGGFSLVGRTLTLAFGKGEDGKQMRVSVRLVEPLPAFARDRPDDDPPVHPIRGLRVVREHGVYYAVFTTRRDLVAAHPLPERPRVIALDPHHYSLATGVDTEGLAVRIPYPHGVRALDRRVDALLARRDRCLRRTSVDERGVTRYHPSRRWAQFNDQITATRARREARVRDYLYTVANWLCKHYDVVAIGDYAPSQNSEIARLNRWIKNESLVGRLRGTTAWVARRSGRAFLTWPEADTTRTCHDCGHQLPQAENTRNRYWTCPACGVRHRRNENNARNGMRRTLAALDLPVPPRVEVTARITWRVADQHRDAPSPTTLAR